MNHLNTIVILFHVLSAVALAQNGAPPAEADSADQFVHQQRDSTQNTWHAVLAGNDAGTWFCAWQMRSTQGAVVRGAFLSRGQREGLQVIEVSVPEPGTEDGRPAVTFLTDSTVLVAWQRNSAGSNGIVARVLHRDGSLDPVFEVSDDTLPGMMPAAGRNAAHQAVVVWQDYRNGDVDIYAQRFDAHARRIGGNMRINDDGMRAMQGAPHVAAGNGSDFLLLWPDNRMDGAWKFYFQVLGGQTANVLIDSAQRKAMTTLISGAWLTEDSAVFTWKDYREGHSNIYRRTADLHSGTFSPAERINDDRGDRWQRLAVVDTDGKGHTVICWEDYRNTEVNQRGDIYLQVFARDGSRAGPNIKVNDRDDRIARKMPAIVMDPDGWYLVIWHQGEEGSFHIAGQWLRYPDQRVGLNFCLSCAKE